MSIQNNDNSQELLNQPQNNFGTENKEINEVIEDLKTEITELQVKKTAVQEFIDFFKDLIVILIVVLIIRTFIAAPFQISGSSMETSYHDKEFIIVNKFSYTGLFNAYIGNPSRGDVVIFKPHANNGKDYYIKRVIALAGETVKFQDGEVYLKKVGATNFIKLNEDYLSAVNKGKTFLPFDVRESEFTVPEGEYFLMGDNRNNSSDSRSCFMSCSINGSTHFIKRPDIIGRVFLDFGYFNVFDTDMMTGKLTLGKLEWVQKPRFLATPYIWDYKELK